MGLSAREITQALEALRPRVQDAWLQDVRQPGPDRLLLVFRAPGETLHLLLSIHPHTSRIHGVLKPAGTGFAAGSFCLAARRHLRGRLESLEQPIDDRTVRFVLRDSALVAELTGAHSNLFVLDGDGRIIATLRTDRSRHRSNHPGELYTPLAPPPPEVLERHSQMAPRFEPAAALPGGRMERFFDEQETALARVQRERTLRRPARRELERARRTLRRVEEEAQRAQRAPELQRQGEALVHSLHSVRRGATSVRVTHWGEDGGTEIDVPMDPALSPKENAERLFRRARRFRQGAERAQARALELAARVAALQSVIAALDAGELEDAAAQLGALSIRVPGPGEPPGRGAGGAGPGRRKRDRHAEAYREFQGAAGERILVGRNATGNHTLTFSVARGNDLWLHARDYSGSHVVVPLARGTEAGQELLQEAALLAARYSGARTEPAVDISYTQRKHVRPSGTPGRVYVAAARTLRVRLDDPRLQALLARRKSR